MGKLLVIAEKPRVARDIASALGGFRSTGKWWESDSAIVASAVGHLVEIHSTEADTGGRNLTSLPIVPAKFSFRPIATKKDQFALLCQLLRRPDVDGVVNACDAGREGELIFRLIYRAAKCTKPMQRMWLQSMTAEAIRTAYATLHPGSRYDNLADAAECRSESDWLVGINGSRGLTYLYERQTCAYDPMSVGRVQTPTLSILVTRERKIIGFVPRNYWEIIATFSVPAGTYTARWFNPNVKEAKEGDEEGMSPTRLFDKQQADALVARCKGIHPSAVVDECKPVSRQAPPFFDLTSLQREANKQFGYSAKQTLDLAQSLYEIHKALTYPRTDSRHLPEDYPAIAIKTLQSLSIDPFAEHAARVLSNNWVRKDKRLFDNSKISDHFAIIPTGQTPANLSPKERDIYDLVVRRFIAAFHPAAEYQHTNRITLVGNERFRSFGKVLLSAGWLQVYEQVNDDDAKTPVLCAYTHGEPIFTTSIEPKGSKTKPPARYTEATLLSAMEQAGDLVDDDDLRDAMRERGLGTPATRASIIETLLINKGRDGKPKEPYAKRTGSTLTPTCKGMGVIDFLEANGIGMLASPSLTGEWEFKLREMEKGLCRRADFMKEIVSLTHGIISTMQHKALTAPIPAMSQVAAHCPRCSAGVVEAGRQYECASGCGFRLWKEVAGRRLSTGEVSSLITDRVVGPLEGFTSKANKKFSARLKLTDDLEVKFDFPEQGTPSTDASGNSIACPSCGASLRRIKSPKGWFWGCTAYPRCEFRASDKNGSPVGVAASAENRGAPVTGPASTAVDFL